MDANCRLLGKADNVTVHWQKRDLNSKPSVISDLDERCHLYTGKGHQFCGHLAGL
jgi:hypothetical protein